MPFGKCPLHHSAGPFFDSLGQVQCIRCKASTLITSSWLAMVSLLPYGKSLSTHDRLTFTPISQIAIVYTPNIPFFPASPYRGTGRPVTLFLPLVAYIMVPCCVLGILPFCLQERDQSQFSFIWSSIKLRWSEITLCNDGSRDQRHVIMENWVLPSRLFRRPLVMVKHLPPAIKHLLSLRNPNSHSSPSLHKLHGILNSTLTDAKRRKAENGWLVLTVCENTHISQIDKINWHLGNFTDMHFAYSEYTIVCWTFVSLCYWASQHQRPKPSGICEQGRSHAGVGFEECNICGSSSSELVLFCGVPWRN